MELRPLQPRAVSVQSAREHADGQLRADDDAVRLRLLGRDTPRGVPAQVLEARAVSDRVHAELHVRRRGGDQPRLCRCFPRSACSNGEATSDADPTCAAARGRRTGRRSDVVDETRGAGLCVWELRRVCVELRMILRPRVVLPGLWTALTCRRVRPAAAEAGAAPAPSSPGQSTVPRHQTTIADTFGQNGKRCAGILVSCLDYNGQVPGRDRTCLHADTVCVATRLPTAATHGSASATLTFWSAICLSARYFRFSVLMWRGQDPKSTITLLAQQILSTLSALVQCPFSSFAFATPCPVLTELGSPGCEERSHEPSAMHHVHELPFASHCHFSGQSAVLLVCCADARN